MLEDTTIITALLAKNYNLWNYVSGILTEEQFSASEFHNMYTV